MKHIYCSILILLFLLTACTPSHSLTLTQQPEAVSWTRQLNNYPLRQTFTVPKEGLSEIELLLALPDSAPELPSRPLQWQILDGEASLLREGVLETAGYLANTPLRLQFDFLAGPQLVEVVLKGPHEANMKLWRSRANYYIDGELLDNQANRDVDLSFSLRVEQNATGLFGALKTAAERWLGVGRWSPSWPVFLEAYWKPSWPITFDWLWVPLLLIAPGWLLVWLFDSRASHPMSSTTAGLSLAVVPLVYVWCMALGINLYEPLVSSLFYIAMVLLLFLMSRNASNKSTRLARDPSWRGALALLALFILIGIATWLLAGRLLLAPPGHLSLEAGLLAQEMLQAGTVRDVSNLFASAAWSFTLALMSRDAMSLMLLLSTLVFGVATIPSIFALAIEIMAPPPDLASISADNSKYHDVTFVPVDPFVALWLLPFAWMWPAAWQAFASGDLLLLYNLALLPVTMALGLRALQANQRVWSTLFLAAIPLAALMLAQGVGVLIVWLLTWLVNAYKQAQIHQKTKYDVRVEPRLSNALRALVWLLLALFLWLPAAFNGASLWPSPALSTMGYDWLLLIISSAFVIGWLSRHLDHKRSLITTFVVLSLPLLLWWRSAPIESDTHTLTQQEINGLMHAAMGVKADTLFLINVEVTDEQVEPIDGGVWLPLYGPHETVLQRDIAPDILAQAMQLERLNDPAFRQTLQEIGITHIYLNVYSAGPLRPNELLKQVWANLVHQAGPIYIFEFMDNVPEPVG